MTLVDFFVVASGFALGWFVGEWRALKKQDHIADKFKNEARFWKDIAERQRQELTGSSKLP